ncbi:hypothetical protein EZJ49_11805 [Bdellovibrio bacteriovorus]|uniref:hypothetical protein n=1 Tax=Bdellovibrio bacteriovorus TaxID=959 RepID=UPI0021D34290|nr:hypothetical protein [Bdellovibrio bacteriovorus]UXR63750.1 hypothetical protein EZJ49_11805 [Bdellovibrio bacteriovorus]
MLTVLSIILSSSLTFAGGDWVGNGGNVLECASGSQVQLLDYYEGQQQRHIPVNLGSGVSYHEKVLFVLSRLEVINPSRADKYKNWFATFDAETQWFSEGKFLPIRDSGAVIIPTDCEIRQIAIQRPQDLIMPGDKRYLVDLRLWNRLSEQDKAGLILHELIYREGIENDQSSSPRVRYFNQILSSVAVASYSSQQLMELVRQVGFSETDYMGVPVNIKHATYHDSGALRGALGIAGAWKNIGFRNKWIGFFESGRLEHISMDSLVGITVELFGQKLELKGERSLAPVSRISFYEDGSVAAIPLVGSMEVILQGQKVRVANVHGAVSFWPNGQLQAGTLLDSWAYSENGRTQSVSGAVELDVTGRLIPNSYHLFLKTNSAELELYRLQM